MNLWNLAFVRNIIPDEISARIRRRQIWRHVSFDSERFDNYKVSKISSRLCSFSDAE